MGLSTWVAFTPAKNGVMFMGDIVITETDLKPVQHEIIKQGLTSTAIHNHFVRNHPNIMFMHMGGLGSTEVMAQKAKAVLDKVIEVRGGDPSKGTASSEAVTSSIDTKMLDGILGTKGEMTKGVYKYTIGRPDVKLMEHGVPVSTFLGFNFLFTIDAYQIDIHNKIIVSEALTVSSIAVLNARLQGTGIQQISFFTNHVNTQTRGIDVVTNYKTNVGKSRALNASLAFTLNKTKVTEIKKTPRQLQEGTAKPIAIIDKINIALIETAQPRQKVILSLVYSIGKFNFIARGTYFGGVTAWENQQASHIYPKPLAAKLY